MSQQNGDAPWHLRVQMPAGYEDDTRELFWWLRHWLLPAVVHAPFRITLHLIPPEDTEDHPLDHEPP